MSIGSALQAQYERWQPAVRFRQCLDPTVEEVARLCTILRRNARGERVLFHYNGHGVVKPTDTGELWVFNSTCTQYIPVSIFDIQTWMGAPSIYVFDCSRSGFLVEAFRVFADHRKNHFELEMQASGSDCDGAQSPAPPSYHDCILLAACGANEILPMHPDLPADLFTACLTTPIQVALLWCALQPTSSLVPKITLELLEKIPGHLNDRMTMLGELNWIFTAVTDTIAWNTLPNDLFQKLFRQDLLLAGLCRNFLLADRILRSYDCTPVSYPALPPTFQHRMWDVWDLALDLGLCQLPGVLAERETFVHLPFFEEQLTAFEVWLPLGSEHGPPPELLPIVLQALLSSLHRIRALELLAKFLDLGPWAVSMALTAGIYPYVLKLLQTTAKKLRPSLLFVWAKIIAVDTTCQVDMVRANAHKYFLTVLQDSKGASEHRIQSAFVLASIVHEHAAGQQAALQGSLVSICVKQLGDPCTQLRQWLAICLARVWDNYEKARWIGFRDSAHKKLYTLLQDPSPEVRAAAVYALGTFINSVTEQSAHTNNIDRSIAVTLLNTVRTDMSSLVRQELVVALQWIVQLFENTVLAVALPKLHKHHTGMALVHHTGTVASGISLASRAYRSVYTKLWHALTHLNRDPHPEVARMSRLVTGHIRQQVREINFGYPNSGTAQILRIIQYQEHDENRGARRPLVQSQFAAWACKHFAQPVLRASEQQQHDDVESSAYYEREWRYMRNAALRQDARAEQARISTNGLKKQVFNIRNPYVPHVLQFHPYEEQIAVAGKDSFSIWDWDTGAQIMYCQKAGAGSKLTACEWVNAHDVALLMAASDDGNVKVWRTNTSQPVLVSAWHALSDITNTVAGTVIAWEQWTQTLVTSGNVRYIRLWDTERELKFLDIPTGADCSVSCIDSTYAHYYHNTIPQQTGLITVGCADGSVRLFDRRLSTTKALVKTWREHNNRVLALQLRGDEIISGSSSGDVNIYDIRQTNPISTCQVVNAMSSLAIHRSADLYACGSAHPSISIHNLSGATLDTVRVYEGLMRWRTGSVRCLTYHPHRMALAAAATNRSTVTVYRMV